MVNNRNGWLWDISRHLGLTSNENEIDTVPKLKQYLKEIWEKVPSDCGSLNALEGIAFRLGVPGATEKELIFSQPQPTQIGIKGRKRKSQLSYQEIYDLYQTGLTQTEIAKHADISKQRVSDIIKEIKAKIT
jgi:hypothetical protein